MRHIFAIGPPFRVPDGTWVSPFLNARDSESNLPFHLLNEFSLAAGTIEPHSRSKIHIMPFLTQVTFVLKGKLVIRMKGPGDSDVYDLHLSESEAALTELATFLQLINDEEMPCELLYIISPPFTFEAVPNRVLYDDARALDEDWDALRAANWNPASPLPTIQERRRATRRLARRKQRRGSE